MSRAVEVGVGRSKIFLSSFWRLPSFDQKDCPLCRTFQKRNESKVLLIQQLEHSTLDIMVCKFHCGACTVAAKNERREGSRIGVLSCVSSCPHCSRSLWQQRYSPTYGYRQVVRRWKQSYDGWLRRSYTYSSTEHATLLDNPLLASR